jgi:hypothetical protein
LNEDERLEEGLSLLLASKQRWTRMEEVNSPSGVGIEVNEDGREVYSPPDAKMEFSLFPVSSSKRTGPGVEREANEDGKEVDPLLESKSR